MQPWSHLVPSEKLFLVEAAYGRAMLRAHGIEKMLATWLICFACARSHESKWHEETVAIKRLTLGKLIQRFQAESAVSESLSSELLSLLALRNDLAHRVSDLLADAALTERWEEQAFLELTAMNERLAVCRTSLLPFMAEARALAGLSEEQVAIVIRETYPGARVGAQPIER